ncbi:MAG: 2-oxoacid:ferredoxin oxidoreductase subunit beta, partial [Solirubrobacteraceae bacterium]
IGRTGDGSLEVVEVADVGEQALVVHDPQAADPGLAYSLAHLAEEPSGPTPIGIFREVHRPAFRRAQSSVEPPSEDQLGRLLVTEDAWTIA